MRSLECNFGYDIELEPSSKGLISFFDALISDRSRAQAGIYYDVIKTPTSEAIKSLNNLGQVNNIKNILEWYDFYTLFLVMSVKMDDPGKWALNWARFIFEIKGDNVSVLSFAPTAEGIKAEIEKNGSRDFNMSLSAEIGPSIEHKTSGPEETSEITFSSGAKITPNVAFDKKRGWTVKFDDTIEEVKGFITRTRGKNINLQWDIYRNKAIEVPDSNIGVTIAVYSTAMMGTTKKSIPTVKVDVSGETIPKGTSLRRRGSIELTSLGEFDIQPTLI